jgi:hypothetical protein
MRSKLRDRITYANVVATLALFIALGGTSVAAIQLGKNSVRAKQIAPGAVGTSEVKDRALKRVDFAKGQLPDGGLKNLVVREFSTTVPYMCTDTGGGLPGVPTIINCTTNVTSVTATCQPGERPIFATAGGTPEPVGGPPTTVKIAVSPFTVGTAAGPKDLPVNATLICASP